MSPTKIVARRSEERGMADHDWLKTFHTFTFSLYNSTSQGHFGALRVINEDRVAPHTGFGTHSHREFEIFTYIVAGELEHKDSMGNVQVLRRGDLQLTSAGTGITHSEKAHGLKQVHFLQIWSRPSVPRLPPRYYTRHFTDIEKTNRFICVVAPFGDDGVSSSREGYGPAPVHSPLSLFATLLSPSFSVNHTLLDGPTKERKAYVLVVQTSGYNAKAATGATVKVVTEDGVEVVLKEGDGAFICEESGKEIRVENVGERLAEVLLFDLD